MKKRELILIVLVLVALGLLFLMGDKVDNEAREGEIVEINRDQIAFDGPTMITVLDKEGDLFDISVPSMGIGFCDAVEDIADVGIASVGDKVRVFGSVGSDGSITPCSDKDHYLFVEGFVGDAVFGYEFSYRKGPDGYIALENNDSQSKDFVAGVTLINKREYEILQSSTDPREGPPSMSLRIYKNPLNLHAPVWAIQNPKESNIELKMGTEKEAVVGGANATHYLSDGLYPTQTYIVANGGHVYVLMGSYLEKNSDIYKDFEDLLSSFRFTPTESSPQGKIDIKTVCEEALIYMTFPSSTEADAFVQACVEGKHTEVIDRFLKDNNLDGATI